MVKNMAYVLSVLSKHHPDSTIVDRIQAILTLYTGEVHE